MSWRTSYHDGQGSVRLLSLDGGGIRGLSSLIILKHLMKRVDPKNPPKPCDYFQLIGGTSTGGLIAIMLGRLRMSVDECIEKYLQLSAEAFKLKRSKLNLVAKGKDLWKADGKYRSETLAQEFRNAAMDLEGDPDALLLTPDTSCRVFVCANSKTLNQPVLIRSYKTDSSVNNISTAKCRIWEAARATSAASTFFDPIQIGNQFYVDGATGMNNPVEAVLLEAKAIWPEDARDRIQCLVSIGTGVPALKDFGDNLAEIGKTLKSLATDTQRTEERFYKNHAELGVGVGRYFRFNVDNGGLSDVGLDEQEKKEQIIVAAEMYLEQGRTRDLVSEFLKARAPQDRSVSGAMKDTYLAWLPFVDPRQQHNEARSHRPLRGTGGWFVHGKPFYEWAKTPAPRGYGSDEDSHVSSFLWLHAGAGCGKTVLTSAIIDHIERRERAPLGFLYLSFQGKDQHSGMVDLWHFKCTLLVQILKHEAVITPDPLDRNFFLVPAAFRRLYDKYYPSRRPSMEDLDAAFWEILSFVFSSSLSKKAASACYFVVDGLDEYPEKSVRRGMVAFLGEIISRFPFNTHVLVTSRPGPDISTAVTAVKPPTPAKVSTLPFDKDVINRDIRDHLTHLSESGWYPSYSWWSDDLKKEVISQLTEQADGVFRWADLQIRALSEKEREKDVRKALKQLPRGLEETHERMLQRIEEGNESREAIMVLSWLACAKRPLSLAEVAEVIAFEVGDSDESDSSSTSSKYEDPNDDSAITFDPSARYPNPDSLRRILGGLVTFTERQRFALWDAKEDLGVLPANHTIVAFAHFSVKQYLQSKQVAPPKFRLEPLQCSRLVFRCCLEYMKYYDRVSSSQVPGSPKAPNSTYPLLLYTWQHTWAHALEGYGGPGDGHGAKRQQPAPPSLDDAALALSHLAEDQFQNQESAFAFMTSLRYALWRAHTAFGDRPEERKILMSLVTKHNGLPSIVQDSTDGPSPWPIIFTSLDRLEEDGRSIAHVVAALAEPSLMRMLLDIGIRPPVMEGLSFPETLLHALAAGHCYLERKFGRENLICQSYLESHKDKSRSFVPETAKRLLDAGWMLYAVDGVGRTPLHTAACAGETSAVECLLDHDSHLRGHGKEWKSDPWPSPHGRQDSEGKSPLLLAVSMGHLGTVDTLLESMDNVAKNGNISDNRGRTPLIEAAAMKCHSVLELLLRQPEINVNATDNRGRTALFWAVWAGVTATVGMLLAYPGVETHTIDVEGWNLLICAAEAGHHHLIQTLLQRLDHCDLNRRDIHGRTALSWAVFRGHKATVDILLRQPGLDARIKDFLGYSPLDWALFRGHGGLAQMLTNSPERDHDADDFDTKRIIMDQVMGGRKKEITDIKIKQITSFGPELGPFKYEVWCTNFSHDGRRLAIGGSAKLVEIWDIKSHKLTSTLKTPNQVSLVSWSPNDALVVTCTLSGALVWDVENATCLRVMPLQHTDSFEAWISSCVWSPNNEWFILGLLDSNRSLWKEVLDKEGLEEITMNISPGFGEGVGRIEFMELLADRETLAIAFEKSLSLLNIHTMSLKQGMILHSRISGMCANRDLSQLLVNCSNGELLLLDTTKELCVVSRYLGGQGGDYVQRCSFGGGIWSEDFVLTGSEDGSILVWNKATTELLIRLESQHRPRCNTVAWSPVDPSIFVSGGDDFKWKVWEVTYSDSESANDKELRQDDDQKDPLEALEQLKSETDI